jgi:hypothetical protein
VGALDDCAPEAGNRDTALTHSGGQLFVIRTFPNDVEARLAEAVLDANGIDASIIGDNAAGMLPYLNAMHPIRLVVKESDVEAALALLSEPSVG